MAIAPLSIPQYQMAGDLNFSPLARIAEEMKLRQQQAARQDALSAYAGGDPNALLRSGDTTLAQLYMQDQQRKQAQANSERDFAFRQQEAGRAQKNSDRSYGLQQRQFEESQDYTPEELTAQLVQAGVDPKSPQGQAFILNRGAKFDPSVGQQPQKTPFSQALEKADAERVGTYIENSKTADEGVARLDRIDALRKEAFTGPVIGAVAAKVGHGATQALEADTNSLALDVAQRMKGALSDKDIPFIKGQVPTAAMGGAAGEAASGALRAGFERTKQQGQFYRSWAEQYGNLNGADAAWSRYTNENPLTIEDKKALGGRKFNPSYNKDFSKYLLRPGIVQDGYRFKGGDPGDQNNWIKVN